MEIKATSTLLPGHTGALTRLSNLAEDLKAGSILEADVKRRVKPPSIRLSYESLEVLGDARAERA